MRSSRARAVVARTIAIAAGGFLGLEATLPSYAQDQAPNQFFEIETKYIFGFSEGSGIGLEGEKEFSIETVGRFGKRDGRYTATETKFEFEYTPNQYIQLEFGPLAAGHFIRDVTDLDNRRAFQPSGFFGEIRYLLLDRPASPVAVTVSFEPNYRAFDETSGARVTNFEFETKIMADVELVKNRVYAAMNLIYEPEITRVADESWEQEST
ncbi:MAG: hypothetical protein ACXWM1_13995, partial [Candidatus Binataceae bacterium]